MCVGVELEIKTAHKFVVPNTYSGPTPFSDGHTHFSADSTPTLQAIMKFIVCEVAADWSLVAIYLGVEVSVIDATEKKHRSCALSCVAIFKQWLSWKPGTGKKKRTWHTVLSAVEYAGHRAFSQRLKTDIFLLQ